jgi:hypothetical protein
VNVNPARGNTVRPGPSHRKKGLRHERYQALGRKRHARPPSRSRGAAEMTNKKVKYQAKSREFPCIVRDFLHVHAPGPQEEPRAAP